MVPFPMTLGDSSPIFQGHEVTVDALDVLCAQLTRGLFVIVKFLLVIIKVILVTAASVLFLSTVLLSST